MSNINELISMLNEIEKRGTIINLAEKVPRKDFILFDTISSLYIFHPTNVMERFIYNLVARIRRTPMKLVMIGIKEEIDAKSLAILTATSDTTIEI